ncbi:hypothetical protein ACHWQZ_G001893 [Mnemiopsis leidyi]
MALTLDHFNDNPEDGGFILQADLEKAFDSVSHKFLFTVLQNMGFGNYLVNLIKIAFNGCMSFANVNGHLSSPIYLLRGLHQGSPLSPVLFLLVSQVLTKRLENNPDIRGLSISGVSVLTSLFADDTDLFMEATADSVDAAIHELVSFGRHSGCKPNINKTKCIPLGAARGEADLLQYLDNRNDILQSCRGDSDTWLSQLKAERDHSIRPVDGYNLVNIQSGQKPSYSQEPSPTFQFTKKWKSVFRKPTHTNLYTKYSSCTTNSSKDSVIRSLTRRAYNLCSPQHLDSELQTVTHICLLNGFPPQRITSIMEEVRRRFVNPPPPPPRRQTPNRQTPNYSLSISLPYHPSLSKPLKKILGQHDIKVTHSFSTTPRNPSQRRRPPLLQTSLPTPSTRSRLDCNTSYNGQTYRPLIHRMKEHERCHRLNNAYDETVDKIKSAPAHLHSLTTGNRIAWNLERNQHSQNPSIQIPLGPD